MADAVAAPPQDVRLARQGTAVVFAVHGTVAGSFAARIPWIADRVDAGSGELGLALAMAPLGAVASMPFAGRIVHRFDTRTAARVLMTLWCLALLPTALAPNLVALSFALVVYGATSGLSDIAMNAQGALVEQRYGRSVMSGLHGFWSGGVLLGSGLGVFAARADVDARVHFAVVAVVLVAVVLAVCGRLLDDPAPEGAEAPAAFTLPSGPVLLIGLLGLCAVFAEGASLDWSAVYMRRELDASPAMAAAAVTLFALAMASSRLVGDRVIDWIGPVDAVRGGAVLSTAGALAVATASGQAAALAGFALIGVGCAVVIPLVFAAAARRDEHAGRGIAGVATIAYGAGLAAPAAIGGIAELTSLPVSFGVVAALTTVMGLMAPLVRRP